MQFTFSNKDEDFKNIRDKIIEYENNSVEKIELKQLHKETELLLNSLPFYIIIVDEDHYIFFANKAVNKEFDCDPQEIIGKYCPREIHNCEEPISECPLEKAKEINQGIIREYYDSDINKWLSSQIYLLPYKTMNNKSLFLHFVIDITARKNAEQNYKKTLKKYQTLLHQGNQVMAKMVESSDPYTFHHQKNVSELADKIAKRLNFSENRREGIKIAGLLHDIGKISTPKAILNKSGELNKPEEQIIQLHPRTGYDFLKNIDYPWPVAEIVLQHHERIDGSGYPNHLQGEEINLEAKIIGVADVVDAMCSHRPYRPELQMKDVIKEIRENSGRLYDPDVVLECIKIITK